VLACGTSKVRRQFSSQAINRRSTSFAVMLLPRKQQASSSSGSRPWASVVMSYAAVYAPHPCGAAAAVIILPHHLAGLQQLRQLSLGWCRDLGDTASEVTNNVAALASLTALSSLSLAGTRVDDAQLVALLPQLQQLQVRCAMRCGVM
jgi:hypothetical protein